MRLMDSLRARGFDACKDTFKPSEGVSVTVGCTRCAAVCVNGVPCHEQGCPNARRECNECGDLVPERQRTCESCQVEG